MPMTAAVAPEFARRYPEFAIIFDNLHSMHDVISDVLANDSVIEATSNPSNWAIQTGDYANQRYSELDQITRENVGEYQGWTR